jgi:hypothetical protein
MVHAMKEANPEDDVIRRTAVDALQAKYSAIIYAGYEPPQPRRYCNVHAPVGDNNEDGYVAATTATTTTTTTTPNTSQYFVYLLKCMTEYYIPIPKRQIPLINAGYGIRVATVLHQIESYVSLLQQHEKYYRSTGTSSTNSHQNIDAHLPPVPQSPPREIQIIIIGCGLDVTGLWSLSLLQMDHVHTEELSNQCGMHVIDG